MDPSLLSKTEPATCLKPKKRGQLYSPVELGAGYTCKEFSESVVIARINQLIDAVSAREAEAEAIKRRLESEQAKDAQK